MTDNLRQLRVPLAIFATVFTLVSLWQIAGLNPSVSQLTFHPLALVMWFFIAGAIMYFLQLALLWLIEITILFETFLFCGEKDPEHVEYNQRLKMIGNLLFAGVGWFFSMQIASTYSSVQLFSAISATYLIAWIEGVFVVNLILLGGYILYIVVATVFEGWFGIGVKPVESDPMNK